jgi:hypothetical protein
MKENYVVFWSYLDSGTQSRMVFRLFETESEAISFLESVSKNCWWSCHYMAKIMGHIPAHDPAPAQ